MTSQDNTQQLNYLHEMGVQSWVLRKQPSTDVVEITVSTAPVDVTEAKVNEIAEVVDLNQLDWPELQIMVSSCTACALHESRTNTVFGVGDQNAQVMVIGEAPGIDEDQQGEPFVGQAGQLLNNMLLAIGYKRDQVYICNTLKCCPPDNRDPLPEEVFQCESFLKRQIALVKPKVILAVGRIAAHNLMKVETPIGKMRGTRYDYGGTPVVVTYHPAYLLRKPSEKAKSWDDLRLALSIIHADDEDKEKINEKEERM